MKRLAILLVALAAVTVATGAKDPPEEKIQACGRTLIAYLISICEEYESLHPRTEEEYQQQQKQKPENHVKDNSLVLACCVHMCPKEEFLKYCFFLNDF